jgi:hypothetical protein
MPLPYIAAALVLASASLTASAADNALHFDFDFETARIVSNAVNSGDFAPLAFAEFCTRPDAKAMVRKMRFKDCDGLLQQFKKLRDRPLAINAANVLAKELGQPGYGKYAPLAAEVSRQLKEYVPADFSAKLTVHFIFGSYSGGFAFENVPDDVYVDLMRFPNASTQELAETVAHELFHAVQTHVMRAEILPAAAGPAARTGPIWLNHFLVHLEQEGSAELFTHPIADRPVTPFSTRRKAGIERNTVRIRSLFTLYESLGLRLRLAPPVNEDAYDSIYGLMFYTDFDETAYDLGWLMANTIAKTDGKMAIFTLLKQPPKNFVLRYQALATADGKLPVFSPEFMKEVEQLE